VIEELLEIFLEGAQTPTGNSRLPSQTSGGQDYRQQPSSTQDSQAMGNPWLDLFEDFMGEQLPQGREPSRQPANAVGGFGLDDLLEIFMGGGQKSNVGGNPMLAPFTETLAEKLGLSPQMASIIVSYAFSMFVSQLGSSGATSASGTQSQSQRSQKHSKGGLDLDDLLDGDFIESQGMGKKIAKRTGLDEQTAQEGLREAIKILGGRQDIEEPTKPRVERPQQAKAPQEERSLQGLLDTWED